MSRDELAAKLNVSGRTIDRWREKGMPSEKRYYRGIAWRWEYDLRKCQQWLEGQKGAD